MSIKKVSDLKSPTFAVLVFMHKSILDWYEEISLRQCQKILGHYPSYLICPEGLDISALLKLAPSLIPEYVPKGCLASIEAYNRFKISSWLYRRFRKYDFLLTYELDAFVFRDELIEWCHEGWDYIGAPWFEGWDNATAESPFIGVGNSGFSLRRTEPCLRISTAVEWVKRILPPRIYRSAKLQKLIPNGRLQDLLKLAGYTDQHEDDFWAGFAPEAFPDLRIAPYKRAKNFSLESNARNIIHEIDCGLPFGCHAWHRCDIEFWRPWIEAEGYNWPEKIKATTAT